MTARDFVPVQHCCRRRCHEKVDPTDQEHLFRTFWKIGDYDQQNLYLNGLMSNVAIKRPLAAPVRANYRCTWHYLMKVRGRQSVVCRKFFHAVFDIGIKRTFLLQRKVMDDIELKSMRGKHMNRPHKISSDIWLLLKVFCESLHHCAAHEMKIQSYD